jgi:biopolymer transport protein ExbD
MIKIKRKRILSAGSIDMTPITDTSFLLIIFFMITTVFKNPSQLQMTLPEAWNPVKTAQVKITVEMAESGDMAINGITVTPDTFEAQLNAEKNKTQSKSIVIRSDQNVKHGDVLKVMQMSKGVGIETISIATEDMNLKEGGAAAK